MVCNRKSYSVPSRPDAIYTVGLATFNGDKHLTRQLESLCKQSFLPHEVLVSDDNSTDTTIDILNDFAASSPFPVRIVTNPNPRGVQSNFRNALFHTTGDIIAWCDQDDIWEPTKLEEIIRAFENPKVQCVAHSYQTIDGDGKVQGEGRWFHGNQNFTGLAHPNILSFHGCCMAFRAEPIRSLLLEHWPIFSTDGSPAPLLHDFATLFIARHLGEIQYLDKPLTRYRRHGSNYSEHKATDLEDAKQMRRRTTSDTYRDKGSEAQAKAEWWRQTLDKWPNVNAAHAVADYERYANNLERRAHLYSVSHSKRLVKLLQNVAAGSYGRSSRGQLPLRSLLGDLTFVLKRSSS